MVDYDQFEACAENGRPEVSDHGISVRMCGIHNGGDVVVIGVSEGNTIRPVLPTVFTIQQLQTPIMTFYNLRVYQPGKRPF